MEDNSIFTEINLLRQNKDWPDYVINVNKIENIILNLNIKDLKNNLYIILPCILDILNNFIHKIKGIDLLYYLLNKLSKQDFKRQGYDDLIIYSIKNLFYHQEEEIYNKIFDLSNYVFTKFEFNPIDKTQIVTKLDEIINIVLNQIEIGVNEKLKLICLNNLNKLIILLDKAIYKFLDRLINICIYLMNVDFIIYKKNYFESCLTLLEQLIELTTELSEKYINQILIHLIKLLYCLNELDYKTDYKTIEQKTFKCIYLLKQSNTSIYNQYINCLKKNNEIIKMSELISNNLLPI